MNEFVEKLIERLEKEHEGCINRYGIVGGNAPAFEVKQCIEIVKDLAAEYNDGWIPFTQRESTEDEKEFYGEDCEFMLDCKLPDEDEEILVTYKFKDTFYVNNDIFLRDGCECYLDSGRDFITEAIAWMPFPKYYVPKGGAE